MAKRFTDTCIWKNQRWFRKLTPNYKLVFCYIKDQCDHAGLWKIDCSDLIEDLGLDSFRIEDFVASVNTEYDKTTGEQITKERLIIHKNFLWITGFIQFQYQNKASEIQISPPVKTALLSYIGLDIFNISINKGYITLIEELREKYITLNDNLITLKKDLCSGYITAKDKDKDKVKEKDILLNNKGKAENFKKPKALRFDEEIENAIFDDGSLQKLGSDQKILAQRGQLKAISIIYGSIY